MYAFGEKSAKPWQFSAGGTECEYIDRDEYPIASVSLNRWLALDVCRGMASYIVFKPHRGKQAIVTPLLERFRPFATDVFFPLQLAGDVTC
jgi:hypothetical protein